MMYEELVKALRCDGMSAQCETCKYDKGFDEDETPNGCDFVQIEQDAAAAIEALQAEVKRLKDANDELREAQTYIDHYGDKWLTSAKDVPTAAYEHGYMDGRDEAMAKMEVQG